MGKEYFSHPRYHKSKDLHYLELQPSNWDFNIATKVRVNSKNYLLWGTKHEPKVSLDFITEAWGSRGFTGFATVRSRD